MTTVAYVRFSDDDLDAQVQSDLVVLNIDRLYQDVGNSRDGLTAALQSLRHGDCLVVARLGCGAGGVIKLAVGLRGRGVHLASLAERIDTRTHDGWSFYQHLIALSAMERELTKEGNGDLISVGPPRGRKGGRNPKLSPAEIEEIEQDLWRRTNAFNVGHVAKKHGISRATMYRYEALRSALLPVIS